MAIVAFAHFHGVNTVRADFKLNSLVSWNLSWNETHANSSCELMGTSSRKQLECLRSWDLSVWKMKQLLTSLVKPGEFVREILTAHPHSLNPKCSRFRCLWDPKRTKCGSNQLVQCPSSLSLRVESFLIFHKQEYWEAESSPSINARDNQAFLFQQQYTQNFSVFFSS